MFLENEANTLCGTRYAHQKGRTDYRYGKQSGFIYAGGQRVPIQKPRVILRHMILGVSTRKYDQVIDHATERLSIKKSAISDAFKTMTKKKLREFGERRLEHEDMRVVFLDGTPVSGEMMLAALGINSSGKKMVLEVRQGNTENTEVVEDLLKDMKNRGLNSQHGLLFVVDGGKALSNICQIKKSDARKSEKRFGKLDESKEVA